MLLTAIGAFFGALLSLLAGMAIEFGRKPKLRLTIEEPPVDQTYANRPATHARFARVVVLNKAMPKLLRWLGRSAAYQCTGQIQFHHFDDGAPIFSRAMPARWALSDEPVSYQLLPGGQVAQLFDPVKYNAAFRRDCFPGSPELVDIAVRYDAEDDCYGWSNESYLPDKGWRNPEFKLPKGRYLVKVTIRSAGEDVSWVFTLENSVARQHFRLLKASSGEYAKIHKAGYALEPTARAWNSWPALRLSADRWRQNPSMPSMNTHETLRRFYARLVTATAGVAESRIVDAFASVKRERFVGPGPWQIQVLGGYMATETDDPAVLYQDINIGLAPARGVNNGQPSLHSKCMGEAAPKTGDVVIHVGAGTGYYTAILAHLVGPSGRVHAYEIEPEMARRAAENLVEYATVTVYANSTLEVPLPSADVIYVSAGATHIPGEWVDALAAGGRLVLPLTPNERLGCMLLVTRRLDTTYAARVLSPAAFIPCVGARDDSQSRALAAALDARSPDDIRSLQRGSEPDETAWCIGNGWWLSTADPVGDQGA